MGNVSRHLTTEGNGLESADATMDGLASSATSCTQLLHKQRPDLPHHTSHPSTKCLRVCLSPPNENTSYWAQRDTQKDAGMETREEWTPILTATSKARLAAISPLRPGRGAE